MAGSDNSVPHNPTPIDSLKSGYLAPSVLTESLGPERSLLGCHTVVIEQSVLGHHVELVVSSDE